MTELDSELDTELDFVFYGERPALDFANTLRRRKDPHTQMADPLRGRGIARWFDAAHMNAEWAAELPTPVPDAYAKQEYIEQGVALRSRIITLAESAIRDSEHTNSGHSTHDHHSTYANHEDDDLPTPADLNIFASGRTMTYESDTHGVLLPTATADMILSFVAQDALRLFTSSARRRIKMCAHKRCGLLFEDRSNGKRRKWCSMKECGNRTKVARHAYSRPAS